MVRAWNGTVLDVQHNVGDKRKVSSAGGFKGKAGSGPGQPDVAVLSVCIAASWTGWPSEVHSNCKDFMVLSG